MSAFAVSSFAQLQTDTITETIYTWKLDDNYIDTNPALLDTSLKQFQVYKPNYITDPLHSDMGNLGLPSLPHSYNKLLYRDELFFLKYYLPFVQYPDNRIFVNTKKPFTQLNYTTGGQKKVLEQSLKVLHTQNVNENLNAGLEYKLVGSEGQYTNQKSSIKALALFTNWVSDKYTLHATFDINNILINENGGIINDEDLGNNESIDIPVNLGTINSAASSLKNTVFLLSHGVSLGGIQKDTLQTSDSTTKKVNESDGLGLQGKFSHVMLFQKDARKYSDDDPTTGFYNNIYADSTQTLDSLYARTFKNTLIFDFKSSPDRKFSFGGGIAVSIELNKYSDLLPGDTIYNNDNYSNKSLSGYLFNDLGEKFNWRVKVKNYYSGYYAGDFLIDGSITKSFSTKKGLSKLVLKGKFENKKPAFQMNYYHSNNFVWENDFEKIITTKISAKYTDPGRFLNASFNYFLTDNQLYFDTAAIPAQINELSSVLSFYLSKEFHLGKFHFINKILVQKTDHQEEINLPLLSLYNSTYFEHDFHFKLTGGNLLFQTGFDVYYNTPYYAMAFMPATGQFYNQDRKKLGNYPYVNLFINFKLKRTRFFLMLDHANSGVTGNDYFSVLHYPLNQRTVKFGLSWTFYD